MTTDSQQAASPPPPPPAGFWKVRHAVIGLGVLVLLVVLMMRACGDDEPEQQAHSEADKPRQSIAVQIPASQWPAQQPQPAAPPQPGYGYAPLQPVAPQQPGYGYVPPQSAVPQQPGYGYVAPPVQQPQAPVTADNNPWAVQTQPQRSYGQYGSQQWGQPQPRQPQYVQPSTGLQYRPLEQESTTSAPRAPVVQQPVQGYRPLAPYDRLSGSSFGSPGYYPYGGSYPGYYGPGVYGVPGGVYGPTWPGMGPGIGWPGYR